MAKTTSINLVNGVGALSILEGSGVLSAAKDLASGTGSVETAITSITDASLDKVKPSSGTGHCYRNLSR